MPTLGDGRRLHLQHGPIDLIIEAEGPPAAVQAAYARAEAAFPEILPALVADLPRLREPLGDQPPSLSFCVSKAMAAACWPYRDLFITPMAAVAGAVADHVLEIMTAEGDLIRAYVNNGGDIAMHLTAGQRFSAGVAPDPCRAELFGRLTIDARQPTRGLATSGWRGRSFSLGIADAVTILAATGAEADAAATIVANAVNVDHPLIHRVPANSLEEDSELGDLPVTVAVGALPPRQIEAALDHGATVAERLVREARIFGAVLILGEDLRVIGGEAVLERIGEGQAQ